MHRYQPFELWPFITVLSDAHHNGRKQEKERKIQIRRAAAAAAKGSDLQMAQREIDVFCSAIPFAWLY